MKIEFAVLLAGALAVSASGYAAEGAIHDDPGHDSAAMQKLELNAGKKWVTDAPLRQGMSDINGAMAKAMPLIHQQQFDNAGYEALATTIRQKVGDMVKHCKLQPKADAVLHLVLADLMAGAETMEGKTAHARQDGAVAVLQALNAYGRYFEHPGWQAPRD